ncbi:MAG TPA: EAL domain-containing protein [Acetobacteraceae bacterium]|nr:EAL domain-containing protein [Acetobacteraceae bacterium]
MDGTVGTIRGVTRLRDGRRWLRALRLAPELLVILVCIAVMWGAVSFALWQARVAAVKSARQQTATLARAFAESTERISADRDRELLSLRASFAEKGSAFDLSEWLRTQSSPDGMTLQIGITDRAGIVTQNSVPMNGRRFDLSDREHFRVHLDNDRDAIFISQPVIGRITGRCSVQYTRKLLDRDGGFAGIGVNSVSCDDLSRFYQTVDIGDGFVMLAGFDGVIRGYGPVRRDVVGTDLKQASDFAATFAMKDGTFTASPPWDSVRRIISFRRLEHYPLVVLVGYGDAKVFAQYWPMRGRAIEVGGAMTLIILCLGFFWIQQRIRSAASRQALVLTLENMSQGILMIDQDGRMPVVNRRAAELLGLPAGLLEPGREMRCAEADGLGMLIQSDDSDPGTIEHGTLHKNGRIIEILSQHLRGGGQVRTFTDVTERRIADARIRHMAHHDTLTGLANRAMLNERLAELLDHPDVDQFGLLCLDLDGFKLVNDTLGHEAGDRLLRDVGRRLHTLVGDSTFLARTGGDEFAILCLDGPQPEATEAFADVILTAMTDPIDIDGALFRLSASIGLAVHPADGASAVELIRHADTAMYQAKTRGRGFAVRFDPEMDRNQHERSMIERDLRHALGGHEFEVWFQPRFETKGLRVTGFEALARWRHPDWGFISPVRFIPVAEQCGLIAELGLRVLNDACDFAVSLPDGRIAVNLSPAQFRLDNLADIIANVLADKKLPTRRLELEITEGVLIGDETQALSTLNRLHDRGLQLALDDFGTGYASLSYLRRFPFDRIKIDQSFVRAQEHDPATRAITETILTMASRLRLEVTAEGVETDRQLNLLLDQGCPEVQGFLLGRPMPAAQARAFYTGRGLPEPVRRMTAA